MKEVPCVLCGLPCYWGSRSGNGKGGVHQVRRRGAKPLYVHDACYEALLPKNRALRRILSGENCVGCRAFELCVEIRDCSMTCDEVKAKHKGGK